ncbi:MAG: IPT/TIG domain-containing protein, partial [Rhodothermia bacterium]|nr:IPT/TIG domain-containing protein [Rhodothermia bacterium]
MKAFFLAFVLLSLFLLSPAAAQPTALYEVSLVDRIGSADVVVEGRVVDQKSFWNAERTRIYTANTVEVYRVFSGSAEIGSIDVITPGGVVGMKAQVVSHALRLRRGDVGVFFLSPSPATEGLSKWASSETFEVYAAEQGFIRYDEFSGAASDIFHVYQDIERDVREVLGQKLGSPEVLVDYPAPSRAAQKGSQVPVITSFSPNPITAGTASVLTINGTGFEAQGANSKVLFPNADDGGGTLIEAPDSEEISWSDAQIQVRVPTRAGTGSFVVQTNGGLQGSSATSLTVDYNLINIAFQGFKRSILQDKVNGGYSLVMSTNVTNQGVDFATSDGVDPFDSALATWQTATGLNMRNDGGFTTENTVDPNSDPDIIMFDNDGNPLPSGVLGRAFSG